MATHDHGHEVVNAQTDFTAPAGLASLQTLGLGAGIIGVIVLVVLALLTGNFEGVLRGYLLGFTYWGGIAIGSLGLLLIQHLTGGSWGLVIRRVLEAAALTLPLVLILFVPIMLLQSSLYIWAAEPHLDKLIEHKTAYLFPLGFALRGLLYFGIWIGTALLFVHLSNRQDATGDWTISSSMNKYAAPALIAFFMAVTFAAVDWVMSLDPHWFSAIYGLLFAIGWALSALAFVIALLAWLAQREPMNRLLGAPHFHDLGKILLAFVMVWAYFNLSQLLIIWNANIPEETPWYLRRMEGGWIYVGYSLILLHFALPFILLLTRDLKRSARYISIIAVFILVMRAVDLFYLIAPNPTVAESHGGGHGGGHAATFTHLTLTDGLAYLFGVLAIGGLWLFYFISQYRQRPMMPVNDPYFENAIAHGVEHH